MQNCRLAWCCQLECLNSFQIISSASLILPKFISIPLSNAEIRMGGIQISLMTSGLRKHTIFLLLNHFLQKKIFHRS